MMIMIGVSIVREVVYKIMYVVCVCVFFCVYVDSFVLCGIVRLLYAEQNRLGIEKEFRVGEKKVIGGGIFFFFPKGVCFCECVGQRWGQGTKSVLLEIRAHITCDDGDLCLLPAVYVFENAK